MFNGIKKYFPILVLAGFILQLSACSDNTSNNPIVNTSPSQGGVVVDITPNEVNTGVGKSQNVRIAFQTTSGLATQLKVPINKLPLYWQGVGVQGDNYTCNDKPITSSNGCILTLLYAPQVALAPTSFDLPYSYVNDKGTEVYGKAHIKYSSESANVAMATISPVGLINPDIDVSWPVNVTFSTDKGSVYMLHLTNLESLPKSWHANLNGNKDFICKVVDGMAHECQLSLTYLPKQIENGQVVLNYTYQNNIGQERNAKLSLLYNVTKGNAILASYPEVVDLAFGQTRSVDISFATDDGNSATNLKLDLTHLESNYPGWKVVSGAKVYLCNSVNTSSSCPLLSLIYTPKPSDTVTKGYLNLPYTYKDELNTYKSSSISLWYSASEDLATNVVVTANPRGIISSTLNHPIEVDLNFNSDIAVSDFRITSGLINLNSVNPGWSTATPNFNCPAIGVNTFCKLTLGYTPTDLSQVGAVVLNYSYVDYKGTTHVGSYNINYQPRLANKVLLHLESNELTGIVGGSTKLNYSFITDDGYAASNLVATIKGYNSQSELSNSGLNCSMVTGSSGMCSGKLTYIPKMIESGTLTIGYSYINSVNESVYAQQDLNFKAIVSNAVKVMAITPDNTSLSKDMPLEASINESVNLGLQFTTFSGANATNLAIDKTLLPNSWSILGSGKCAIVNKESNSCSMVLSYLPTDLESGVLTLNYTYTDVEGMGHTGSLDVFYKSFAAWARRARYTITKADMVGQKDLARSSLSAMIVAPDTGLPMFLVTLGDMTSWELKNLLTFKLESNNTLKRVDIESEITWFTPDLTTDNNNIAYRAYNIGNINQDKSNIVVQKMQNGHWTYIGETSGVFKLQPGLQTQQLFPSLAFDKYNNIYLNASGYGYLGDIGALSVIKYDPAINSWYPVGNFPPTPYPNIVSSLAIDYNDNLYAIYNSVLPGYQRKVILYKYNGSFWVKIPTPDVYIIDSEGSLFFDHQNNLYISAHDVVNNKNTLLEYDGIAWQKIGNQDVFNSNNQNILAPAYQGVIDKEDNIYVAVNDRYLSVYKYNRATNLWQNIGKRRAIETMSIGYASNYQLQVGMTLGPKEANLYLTSLIIESANKFYIDLYSYKIK